MIVIKRRVPRSVRHSAWTQGFTNTHSHTHWYCGAVPACTLSASWVSVVDGVFWSAFCVFMVTPADGDKRLQGCDTHDWLAGHIPTQWSPTSWNRMDNILHLHRIMTAKYNFPPLKFLVVFFFVFLHLIYQLILTCPLIFQGVFLRCTSSLSKSFVSKFVPKSKLVSFTDENSQIERKKNCIGWVSPPVHQF